MEVFISLIAIICAILGIILFFKVWGMCNNVKQIHEHLTTVSKGCGLNELIYLWETKSPKFKEALSRRIYVDLTENVKYYTYSFEEWKKLCELFGWEFPKEFAECDTFDKFKYRFIGVWAKTIKH